ncbi:MAG: hypothetical protein DRN20_00640 [Thermoplasmata archaeon]|nr:MAG: hypothetical protein DRN20_00640 [Thermoplasmata archaeon]
MDEEYAVEIFNRAAGRPKTSRFGRTILEGLRKTCEKRGVNFNDFLERGTWVDESLARDYPAYERVQGNDDEYDRYLIEVIREEGGGRCMVEENEGSGEKMPLERANYVQRIVELISALHRMDDDLFITLYMGMSREFERRMGADGWCEIVERRIKGV